MLKSYKFRLSPTRKQAATLQWTLDRCRELYNAAFQNDGMPIVWQKSITCYDQINDLPEIKTSEKNTETSMPDIAGCVAPRGQSHQILLSQMQAR